MPMKSPAKQIAELLQIAAIGVIGGSNWGIFLGKLPTSPNNAICCTASGGPSPFPHLTINFPSVQVMVRGKAGSYEETENKCREIVAALLGLPAQNFNTDFWGGVRQLGDVISLGFDEVNRPLFSCNFSIIVETPAEGYRQSIT